MSTDVDVGPDQVLVTEIDVQNVLRYSCDVCGHKLDAGERPKNVSITNCHDEYILGRADDGITAEKKDILGAYCIRILCNSNNKRTNIR